MNAFHKLVRSVSFLEKLIPKKLRLPFQYLVQKSILALDKEFRVLPQLVDKNKIALDIGANKGIYAYFLAKKCNFVYCFEPLKECCDYIKNYASKKIYVNNCALSNTDDTLELYIPIIKNKQVYTRSSLKPPIHKYLKRSVPVKTLDHYNYKNIGFIKIDVEGAEMSVLKGGIKTLSKSKPNLLVEIDINQHTNESYMEVFNFLYNLGYVSYIANKSELLPFSGNELVMSQNNYNFIFKYID